MNRTTFHVQEMDCPSEERLIRMQLEGLGVVVQLDFDLEGRRLHVFHHGAGDRIAETLDKLNLGAREVEHRTGVEPPVKAADASNRGPLKWAFAINLSLFVGELAAGLLAGSMGLVADSLDMLADAIVYALSLAAVGGSALRKRRLAASSGYLQLTLALLGLAEVIRRFVSPTAAPEVWPMVVVSLAALAGNVVTLLVLRRTERGEAHIEASWIFTSNDIKVNLLVIVAGLLVWWSSSRVPDLLVGGLIFLIVANGARQIFALARGASATEEER